NIGGLYFRNGIFSFDDFKLKIETKHGSWTDIPLIDAGFEEDVDSVNKVWKSFFKRPGFTQKIISIKAPEGKNYLQITGKDIAVSIQYGNNSAAGKYINVNGIKLYYEIYGMGEPLLLLHGNRSPIVTFSNQIPEFAKHFKVIAVDTRGQGKSTEDGKKYTYDLFAEDMNAFLDSLKLDSVNILGWSDGGNTGLIMAMRYPNKVKRLVTMGADVFIDTSVVANWVFKEVKKQLKEFKKDTSYNSRNNYRLADILITEPQHTFSELHAIKCPVLVMAGEDDIIKPGHTKGIAANIPNSTLMIVPKETHYLPEQKPALFNKLVIDFLEKPIN
ncbi:MAG: alpha/beta fold hydrolase, partial [Ginsengibacter sp.]